ncbi:glycosyltransferase [bacterium]|nr:glycosyltransferase [bacterium]MBU1993801.1 glycosyltransferase [bacterium]
MISRLSAVPLISIVTITYNNAEGLRKTLESIRLQDENDFELIVIDGGSIDNTKEILLEFSDIITYSVSEKDRGISHAFNKGTEVAKGQIVNYLNSGDCYIDSKVLSFVKASYLKDKWQWAYGLRKRIDKYNNLYDARESELLKYNFLRFAYSNLHICHQATFIERDIINKLGLYNECYQFLAMDYDLLLKIALRYSPNEFSKYLVIYDDLGISSKLFYKNLMYKHKIRVENLHLTRFQSYFDLLNTFVIFMFGKTRSFIKSILLNFEVGKRLLKVTNK